MKKTLYISSMTSKDEYFMKCAIDQARKSLMNGEFPVGAVLVKNDEIIASAYNRDGEGYLAHAEMLLLLDLDRKKPSFSERREMKLYTTLEPCLMCMGAAISFFVGEIIFSMSAPEDGGTIIKEVNFGGTSIPQYKMPPIKSGILLNETRILIEEYIKKGKPFLVEYSKKLLEGNIV